MDDVLVKEIIAKIRRMFSFGKYRDVVMQKARVEYHETNDGFELSSIKFSYYDVILVTNTGISFFPEHGNADTLLKFKHFNEFLAM